MSDRKLHDSYKAQLKRLLKLLTKVDTANFTSQSEANSFFIIISKRQFSFKQTILEEACNEGLIKRNKQTLKLSITGKSYLKRLLNPDMPFIAQHADLSKTTIKVENSNQPVLKNDSESTLSRLYSRKDKKGVSWIDHNEYQAGERLRVDFERAQLSPKISAHWGESVAGKKRSDNNANDISDFALDAKARLEKAIDALGPELSGITIDVCCFLKGLESVEREKGWPPRSAKLLLKTALSILVRHYGITTGAQVRMNRFWGAENYRPELFCNGG